LTEVVSVKFSDKGKIYFFDPHGLDIPKDTNVVVETAKGLEYGECIYGNHEVDDRLVVLPLRPVVRLATPLDEQRAATNKERNEEAFARCQEKIAEFGLPMKLVSAEHSFDGGKILFFFTSEGRVDFRELVRELASLFKARIELRQIGVRDEAKMLGGLGMCGKPFCCSQFLADFHPVSIKMAKTQGLSLNPVKISGTCGRLMCCLKYEEAAYQDLVGRAPKVDSFVETPSGKGSIVSINLLRGTAKVRLEDGGDTTLKTFTFDDLDVLGGKARRVEYQVARAEGRLEEAGFKPSVIKPAEPRFIPDPLAAPRPLGGNPAPQGDAQRRSTQNRNFKKPASPEKHVAPETAAAVAPAPRPEPVKKPNNRKYWGNNKRRGGNGGSGNDRIT
jgi:cell fate regulator YaaT (PSP1 superfamily)